jgi:hypothetical protein
MTKEEYIALALGRYEELEKLKVADNFYDYEKGFAKIWQDLGRLYMESYLNETSTTSDRRKKTLTRFGEMEVLKAHRYVQGNKNGFGISPPMQELMTHAGHLDCYEKSNEVLFRFLSVTVSPAQVYRVTNAVSESLKAEDGKTERTLYVAHLGNSRDFCEKAEQVIDSYGPLKERLVFLTDGASWIKNWIEDSYSDSVAILDYFHACEHLHEFAENCFKKDMEFRGKWFKEQKSLLYESEVEQVIKNISKTSAGKTDKDKLIHYYQNNICRMDYKRYRSIGCGIIGSGSIESAHRTVIQRRMKLSGQHWSKTGAKNMLRLRVFSMNKQWHKVIDVIKNPNTIAA